VGPKINVSEATMVVSGFSLYIIIIIWCKTTPQPPEHAGVILTPWQCHLRLDWAQSIWGASGTCHYHHDAFVLF